MATTVISAAPTIVSRPTGFEVDEAIGKFLGVENTSIPSPQPRRTYQRSLSDYYESRKSERAATSHPANRTFHYTGQGPAKSIYNRTLYHKVVIAATVTEILPEAFYNWRNLEQVIFEHPSQCQKIGSSAFYGCQKLKQLEGDTLPESLQVIGSNAFACSGLERITLPQSLVAIRQYAFGGCMSLTNIIVPNKVKTINSCAFQDCVNLQLVMLPRNLKRLEASVFSNCQALHTLDVHASTKKKHDHDAGFTWGVINLPPRLLSIGDECFMNCHNFGPFVRLPSTVTSLGNYVLEGCGRVEEVVLPSQTQVVGDGCFRNCTSLERIWLSLDVAFGVGTFEHCRNLQELVDNETNHIIRI